MSYVREPDADVEPPTKRMPDGGKWALGVVVLLSASVLLSWWAFSYPSQPYPGCHRPSIAGHLGDASLLAVLIAVFGALLGLIAANGWRRIFAGLVVVSLVALLYVGLRALLPPVGSGCPGPFS
jgi:hypothetical protein